jgi:phospholipase C
MRVAVKLLEVVRVSTQRLLLGALCAVVMPAGCVPQTGSGFASLAPTAGPLTAGPLAAKSHKVDHVVIIVQENRSVDNLFNGLPGADTVTYGLRRNGNKVALRPEPLIAPYDISHRHDAFEAEYDNGKMDGFERARSNCRAHQKCPRKHVRAYAYVPQWEVKPYFIMAEQYGFGDRMFQSNQGPSFPAHQYLLSGTSTIENGSSLRAAENPKTPSHHWTGGCDSPRGSLVWVIDSHGDENEQVYPCFDRTSLPDLIEKKGLTWRYYGYKESAGLWNAPDAILSLRNQTGFRRDDVDPPSEILSDIANGYLPNVAWVTPTPKDSDHAGGTDGTGPSWVGTVVNAIGKSRFWDDTVVIVVWDDWGGWYDHVKPPIYNSYELGFRVPLIVISPYAKEGYVSHKRHEFGSILKLIEETFGLGSLGTTDVRADNLSDFFDYHIGPRRFTPIPVPIKEDYFLNQPPSAANEQVDDDF